MNLLSLYLIDFNHLTRKDKTRAWWWYVLGPWRYRELGSEGAMIYPDVPTSGSLESPFAELICETR